MSKDAEVPNALPCSLQQTDYTPEAPLQQTLNPPGGLSLSRETHSVRLAVCGHTVECVTWPTYGMLWVSHWCAADAQGRGAPAHRSAQQARLLLLTSERQRRRRSAVDLPSLNLRSWPRILLSLIACCSVASVHREHVRTRCVVDIAPPSPPPVTLLFARCHAGKPRQTRRSRSRTTKLSQVARPPPPPSHSGRTAQPSSA
jgi:hypothetical protein